MLTFFFVLAWYTIQVMLSLPRKLPLAANVLIYMVVSIIDINKLTLISVKYRMLSINESLPYFISLIIHRDIVFTLTFIIFANVYVLTPSRHIKWFVTLYTYLFQIFSLWATRYTGVVTLHSWTLYHDLVVVGALMVVAVLCAKWFGPMTKAGEQYG